MRFLFVSLIALSLNAPLVAGEMTRTEDVIYGRKFGLAMTMDVFEPKDKKNGRGIIFCVSGGFFSAKESINPKYMNVLTDRGYTVFAVVHGSQPRFTIPEILEDMHRATRFIKANAAKWNVDPEKLGISGGSAGGHLSLMQGNAFKPADPKSGDALGKHSSRVAAIACWFPPADLLNYGQPNVVALGSGTLKGFKPPFDFWERNPATGSLERINDDDKRIEIGKQISPVYHVKKDSAPALIIHGDKDLLVPIQQPELMKAAYEKVGVPFRLDVKAGAAHGWTGMDKDLLIFADWFDKYLK